MALTDTRPPAAPTARPGRRARRAMGIVVTLLVALAAWTVGHLASADYVITDPTGSARIDLVATAGVTLVIGLLAWATLALLERFTRRAAVIWTVLAVVVLVASYVPVFLVEATTVTRIALVAVHTAVGVLVIAFRR
jgi:cell division protein FtsW (lipid II flippase)